MVYKDDPQYWRDFIKYKQMYGGEVAGYIYAGVAKVLRVKLGVARVSHEQIQRAIAHPEEK